MYRTEVATSRQMQVEWIIAVDNGVFGYEIRSNKRRMHKKQMNMGPIVSSGSVAWPIRDCEKAQGFVNRANQANWWYFMGTIWPDDARPRECSIWEFLVSDRLLPHPSREGQFVGSAYSIYGNPNVFLRNDDYLRHAHPEQPLTAPLVMDYIGAKAQHKGQPFNFPGPVIFEFDPKFPNDQDWTWNVAIDNHRRWVWPRKLGALPSDSPLHGLFNTQDEWEYFLGQAVGRVISEYEVGELARYRKVRGPAVPRPQADEQQAETGQPPASGRDPRGYLYDGPCRIATPLFLGKVCYWVFEVPLKGMDAPVFCLDPGDYGVSMRWFRSYQDAVNHAENKGQQPVFRVDHTGSRERLTRRRCLQHFGHELLGEWTPNPNFPLTSN